MTASKAARRRARRANMNVPYGRQVPVRNWTVGSQQVDNTGAVVGGFTTPTAVSTWNPGAASGGAYDYTTGIPKTHQLAFINPTVAGLMGANIQIGRVRIDEISGRLHLSGATVAGGYDVAFGVYVSELTGQSSKWDVYNPLSPSDSARDDWFLLDSRTYLFPVGGTDASSCETSFGFSLKTNIAIGGGQAIHLSVAFSGPGSSVLTIAPAVRMLIGPVA